MRIIESHEWLFYNQPHQRKEDTMELPQVSRKYVTSRQELGSERAQALDETNPHWLKAAILLSELARQAAFMANEYEAQEKNAKRWEYYAQNPQLALMLGSKLDPLSKQDWLAECNRLAYAALILRSKR